MRPWPWTHLLASLCGGVVVALVLVALGVADRHATQTVTQEVISGDPTGASGTFSLPGIYRDDAPGVLMVRAIDDRRVVSPFLSAAEPDGAIVTGSGSLIDTAGYVLTAYHLVEGAAANGLSVQFQDGISLPATLVHYDQDNDLAVLRVNLKDVSAVVRPLKLGDSSFVQVGDPAVALANPYGTDRTMSSGIVSALQQQLLSGGVGFTIRDVIETDANLVPGGAGGPLVNAQGQVIGVMTSFGQVAFAVPIDTATKSVLASVLSH